MGNGSRDADRLKTKIAHPHRYHYRILYGKHRTNKQNGNAAYVNRFFREQASSSMNRTKQTQISI